LGCGFGVIAVIVGLVTALPLLGWGNWIFTLPAAVLAIIFSAAGLMRDDKRDTATVGLILGVSTLFWAMFRLSLGGGIF
jgi:hypothetical protein